MLKKILALLLIASVASAQTYYEKTTDPPLTEFNVKSYGAKLNGSDDLAHINAAILAAYNAGGGTVHVPYSASNIGISGPIIIRTNVRLVCDRGATIFLLAGSNSDVLQSLNADTLFGTDTQTTPNNFTIEGCTFDGNKANQSSSSPDLQNGLSLYAYHFTLRDLIIKNILGHGIRSEWYTFGEPVGGMESYVENVVVDTAGRHGWWENGPHDLVVNKLMVIDASQEADNTYDGVYTDTKGSGVFTEFHGWHRGATTNRVQYQASTRATQWTSSQFEGGRSELEARNNVVCTNCVFYAMRGTAGTDAALIDIHGTGNQFVGGQVTGVAGSQYYAFNIGTSGTKRSNNVISGMMMNGFDVSGPFNFAGDGGYNYIEATGFAGTAGGATTPATSPNVQTEVHYWQTGSTFMGIQHVPTYTQFDGPTSANKFLNFATDGVNRWTVLSDSTVEAGSNVGSDFYINAKNDIGGALSTPVLITRASGKIALGVAGTTAGGGAVVANGAVINSATVRQTLTSTYTVPANVDVVRFIQAGTLAASTVTLPTAIADGQPIQFVNYAGQITSLTFSPAVTGWTNTSTLASNTGIRIRWDSTAAAWYLETPAAAFATGTTFAAPGPIGSGTASTGAFSTLSATGAITSTLATGTAPFTVASTTNVANLNASLLNGTTFASPAAIGTGTPAAITGTTITATSFSHGVTTICDVHSAAATDRTAGGTAEGSLGVFCTIPAGIMGTQGTLRVTATWHRAATTTNTTTYWIRLATTNNATSGGAVILNGFTNAGSGNVNGRTVSIMDNTDATHQQMSLAATGVEAGFSSTAIPTGTVDTGSVSYVVFNCGNTSSAADTCGIYGYRVDLYLP